jgi:small subunit ribosomal protein S11
MATQFIRNTLQKQHLIENNLAARPLGSSKYSAHSKTAELAKLPPLANKKEPLLRKAGLKPLTNSSTKAPKPTAPISKSEKRPWLSSLDLNRKQFKAGRAKNKSVEALPKNTNLFCLISINRTKNNTHAIISNLFGENKTKWSISAGQFKLPGGRRKTRLSQRMVYKSCLEKALSFGYKFTVIHCRGTRGSKVRIFRFFGDSLSVLLIKDTTGIAHNGCRPPKVRRV